MQEPSVKPSRSMLRFTLSIRAVPVPVAKRLCERCPALPQEAAALSLVLVRPANRADFRDRRGSVEQSACEDARADGYRRRPLASPLPAARRASEGYSRSHSHHRQVGPSRGAEAADCWHLLATTKYRRHEPSSRPPAHSDAMWPSLSTRMAMSSATHRGGGLRC